MRLSDAYLANNDRGRAIETLHHAAAISPDDPEVARRLQALERTRVTPR